MTHEVRVDEEAGGVTFTTWEPVEGPAPEYEWPDCELTEDDAPVVDYLDVAWAQDMVGKARARCERLTRYYGGTASYKYRRLAWELTKAERYAAAVAAGDEPPSAA